MAGCIMIAINKRVLVMSVPERIRTQAKIPRVAYAAFTPETVGHGARHTANHADTKPCTFVYVDEKRLMSHCILSGKGQSL